MNSEGVRVCIFEDDIVDAGRLRNMLCGIGIESETVIVESPTQIPSLLENNKNNPPDIIFSDGLHGLWEKLWESTHGNNDVRFALISTGDKELKTAKEKGVFSFDRKSDDLPGQIKRWLILDAPA